MKNNLAENLLCLAFFIRLEAEQRLVSILHFVMEEK